MTNQLSQSILSISAHFKFDARSRCRERTLAGRAIVIGGGMAGLMAAQVLSQHFAQVTIVDRDHLSETPEVRSGVPQARHPHTLMVRGQEILEQHFPGLTDELIGQGALADRRQPRSRFLCRGRLASADAPRRHDGDCDEPAFA